MKTWDQIPGWCDFESAYQEAVNRFRSGTHFIEVGCYLGRSVCCLAHLIKQSGKSIKITAVDWCRGSGTENGNDNHADAIQAAGGSLAGALHKNIIDCGFADMITIIVADSFTASQYIAGASADMVFLDAKHDYESVKQDIYAWLPKVKNDGWLAGDDYGAPNEVNPIWPGVRKAVHELFPTKYEHWSHDSWRVKL